MQNSVSKRRISHKRTRSLSEDVILSLFPQFKTPKEILNCADLFQSAKPEEDNIVFSKRDDVDQKIISIDLLEEGE